MEKQRLASWHSGDYAAEWAGDDVLADLLDLPRRISAALVQDSGIDVLHVADLGAGPGGYLELFLQAFPGARGTWVDSSEAMLGLARQRLASFGDRVRFVVGDLERLSELDLEPVEAAVTSRVIHHLSPASIQAFYRGVHELFVPGGFFFNLDHVGVPEGWERRYRGIRERFTGARKRELRPHRHDYPLSPVESHLEWLAAAGFEAADAPWRAFYTALLAARNARISEQASSGNVTVTSVGSGIEIEELQRARISRLPTATTWSTDSPRNARWRTCPRQRFGRAPLEAPAASATCSGRAATTTGLPTAKSACERTRRSPSGVRTR